MKRRGDMATRTTSFHATPRTSWQIFAMPLLLAALTLVGLLSALLGDGIWDFVSWLALGFPVAVIAYRWLKPGTTR